MPQQFEMHRDNFTISTDPSRLDINAIADMLSRAYWAQGRTSQMISRYLQHSLTFGLYDGSRQIGLARVVSDYTTFAWLCDVFIHEEYRGQGLGKWLLESVHSHPELQGVRRWMLATKDAHGLYSQFGWVPIEPPERWMMKVDG
ncbi:MAG: GNAT family N-acetyltransferase [Anaerolineales bacterium]|jgi:GNAT superfamily N-acetyltransferase